MSDFCAEYFSEADDCEVEPCACEETARVSFDGETLDLVKVERFTYACGHSRTFETPVGLLTRPEDTTQPCFHCQRGHDEEFLDPFADVAAPCSG